MQVKPFDPFLNVFISQFTTAAFLPTASGAAVTAFSINWSSLLSAAGAADAQQATATAAINTLLEWMRIASSFASVKFAGASQRAQLPLLGVGCCSRYLERAGN
jgi:hypothetical protein